LRAFGIYQNGEGSLKAVAAGFEGCKSVGACTKAGFDRVEVSSYNEASSCNDCTKEEEGKAGKDVLPG